jgi:hypothetical protein
MHPSRARVVHSTELEGEHCRLRLMVESWLPNLHIHSRCPNDESQTDSANSVKEATNTGLCCKLGVILEFDNLIEALRNGSKYSRINLAFDQAQAH